MNYISLIIHVRCPRGSDMTCWWFSKGKCIRIEQYSIVHVLQVYIFISRKARHSQLTSGAKWYMFWLSHLVSDLIIYAAPAIVSVIAIAITHAPYISGTPREVYVIFFLNWTARSILIHKRSQFWAVISHLKSPNILYCGVQMCIDPKPQKNNSKLTLS